MAHHGFGLGYAVFFLPGKTGISKSNGYRVVRFWCSGVVRERSWDIKTKGECLNIFQF